MSTPRTTRRVLIATLPLAALLALGGCAENPAFGSADGSTPARAQALDERERVLELREVELRERENELQRREHELAQRTPRAQSPPDAWSNARRPAAGEAPPRPVTRMRSVTVPAMTGVEIELLDELSSETSAVGDPLLVRVTRDVVADGRVVIPTGSVLSGQVLAVVPQRDIGGRARLVLGFERLELPSGDDVTIRSSLELLGRRQTKKDAVTIGGSAASGAILGRVLAGGDRDKGTVLGAILGAAVGTAAAARNAADPVVLERGLRAELLLQDPVEIVLPEP